MEIFWAFTWKLIKAIKKNTFTFMDIGFASRHKDITKFFLAA
jgi:hypothetical protein